MCVCVVYHKYNLVEFRCSMQKGVAECPVEFLVGRET